MKRVHVPTLPELAAKGLAVQIPMSRGTAYKPTPEGQQCIYDAMAHNSEVGKLEVAERLAKTERDEYVWQMHNNREAS